MSSRIPFSKPIKIYYFKDTATVDVSFRITEQVVLKTEFTKQEFDYINKHWDVEDGVQGLETRHNGKIWWEHRTVGPRPDEVECDHVVIEIKGYNFRFDTKDVVEMFMQYNHQKENTMYWDSND